MRILFVTQIIPYPPHGGVLQRGYNLLQELGSEHEVQLLAFHHPDELAHGEPIERSRVELGRFCREIEYFPLWVKKSPLHKLVAFGLGAIYPKPFSVLAQRSSALARRIFSICHSARPPDIVHLDTIALAPYRKFCGNVPVVLGHHNIESQLMARRAPHEASAAARMYVEAQTRRLVAYEREHAGDFRMNITVSDADSAMLRSICPAASTAAIPNGVDINYFAPRVGEETPAVIYTGGMNMFANRDAVEWFLDAIWPRIRAAIPDARFFAVGTKPSQKVLDAAQANIGVEAPGFVDDVRPWVARAGVYVVPLRVGGGTRLKMVDAMAQGKAIVATPVGAEGIDGRDGEEFLLAAEPDAFAQTVIRLLGDSTERARLGRAARLRAEQKYAWPILGRELTSIYSRVVDQTSAAVKR
jgi:glycosyltransferase involved in cell wall biosynthesis